MEADTPRLSSPANAPVPNNLAGQAEGAGKVAITLDAESTDSDDSEDSASGDSDEGDSDTGDEGGREEDPRRGPVKSSGERVFGATAHTQRDSETDTSAESDDNDEEEHVDGDDNEDRTEHEDALDSESTEEPDVRQAIEQSIAKHQDDIPRETAEDVSMDTVDSEDEDGSEEEDEEPYVQLLTLVSHR